MTDDEKSVIFAYVVVGGLLLGAFACVEAAVYLSRGTPGTPDAVCRDDGSCKGTLVCTQTISGSRCVPAR